MNGIQHATLLLMISICSADIPNQHCEIFNPAAWNEDAVSFTHYQSKADAIVRALDGAGVLPVVADTKGNLFFLFPVAIVERGTDQNIGEEPVYINPSNYPLIDPKERENGNNSAPYETAIEIASRPEELALLEAPFNSSSNLHNFIKKNGQLIPNAGMLFGRYAIPTFIFYAGKFSDVSAKIEKANCAISKSDYHSLFPTESSIARTDRIIRFELVDVITVLNTIKEQKNIRIEKPLPLKGYQYKLSPYVARTLALHQKSIEVLLQKYKKYT